MTNLVFLMREALKGKTLVRSLMHDLLASHTLKGKVLDLGGGENPSYVKHFQKQPGMTLVTVDSDTLSKEHVSLDLESSVLPYDDNSFDTVLAINLLEHIFNHEHVVKEAYRTLKRGELFIGFVPFLVNVHPDPHDYFRYTNEALEMTLQRAGFTDVNVHAVGRGPFSLLYNSLVSIVSARYLFVLLPFALFLDGILMRIRPGITDRFPLGYLFIGRK